MQPVRGMRGLSAGQVFVTSKDGTRFPIFIAAKKGLKIKTLQGERIAPWHCVVLRGQQRTIVRRLSAATRLNHAAFHDAELVSGDRLTVGNVEFEVLAGPHSLRPRIRPERRPCSTIMRA